MPTEPLVNGYIKPHFFAANYAFRKFALHQFLQDVFQCKAAHFVLLRQRCRKFYYAMIKVWRTNLKGMRHAHPVQLVQYDRLEKILLIEQEVAVQIFAAGVRDSREQVVKRE